MRSGVKQSQVYRPAALVAALVSSAVLALALASQAEAHGIVLEQRAGEAVEIQAAFDTGEPMSEGQVAVYAPGEPEEPWRTGLTDSEGRYSFIPDSSQPGEWEVEVRQAGHGETITVPVEDESGGEEQAADESEGETDSSSAASSSAGFGTGQMALMGALGVWGFVGTALFFSRRRS